MSFKKILYVTILTLLVTACAYKGDGKYENKTTWLLLYPLKFHDVKFEKFDLAKTEKSYSFENICSNNKRFELYLHLSSSTERKWWNEQGTVHISLKDIKGMEIFESVFAANNASQYTFTGIYEDSHKWYRDVRRHTPTQNLVLRVGSEHALGCDKYKLEVSVNNQYAEDELFGQLRLVSSWD